jgi:membrane protein YdbS with pleckstrin-like domain
MQNHMRKQVNKAINIYYRKSQPASSSVSIEILTVFCAVFQLVICNKYVRIHIKC